MQEIIYTSAQSGLKPGSSGFCTVVCTAGMDQRTAQRLEGLSGYRHPFAVNDPRNPVNYQHVTMRIGTAKTHVLSRVCDAGPDHTGRTNKLAHHLAFTQPPSPSGPARLLDAGGVFVDKWDGQTSQRPSRSLPAAPLENSTLAAWASLTGDGGWAGHIAEQLIRTKQPVYVLFSPATDTLALLKEVVDVVPPNRRWGVTFSTYYTNAIAGAECQLRFVLDATQDATKLRNDARATIIDLTANLPQAIGGDLVDLARKGRITYATPAVQKPVPQTSQTVDSDDIVDDWEEPDLDDPPSASVANTASSQPDTAPPRPQAPNLFGAHRSQKDRKLAAAGKRSGQGWIVGLVLGIFLLIGGVSVGVWFLVTTGGSDSGTEKLLAESELKRVEAERLKEERDQNAAEKQRQDEDTKRKQAQKDKEAKERLARDEAEKRKKQEREAAARVAESNPKANAPVVKEILTDIFGDRLATGAKLSDPVVRIIPWAEDGVIIPVINGTPIDLMLHHHQNEYTVKDLVEPKGWKVDSGVKGLTAQVAKIHWQSDDSLLLKRVGLVKDLPWSVVQLNAKDRCGFVLFQKPELHEAISLAEVLSTVNDKNTRGKKVVSNKTLDSQATQRVELKDQNGKVVQEKDLDLASSRYSNSPCEVEQKLANPIEFHFAGGPIGSEHRHAVRLLHDKSGSRIEYSFEFVKRKGIGKMTAAPNPSQRGVDWGLWFAWLQTRLNEIYESHSERVWSRIDSNPTDRCKEEARKLSKVIDETTKGLQQLRSQLSYDLSMKGLQPESKKLDEKDADKAILEKLPEKGFADIKTSLEHWGDLRETLDQISKQPADAAKSRTQLEEYKLHFSVYLPIDAKIKLPGRPKLYRLQIPVIEFSDRKSEDELSWNDILFETNEDSLPDKTQNKKPTGRPLPREQPKELLNRP